MFPVNYGDKQMVPIQKLFSKLIQGSRRYNNNSAENADGKCYYNKIILELLRSLLYLREMVR